MQRLLDSLNELGIVITPSFDGVVVRNAEGNAWLKGRTAKLPTGAIRTSAQYGWYSDGLENPHTWESKEPLTPEEHAAYASIRSKWVVEDTIEKKEDQGEAAKVAADLWERAGDRGRTSYMERKGLTQLHGARLHPDQADTLLVPLRDVSGHLWNLQKIWPDGKKRPIEGGRLRGCFLTLGEINATETVYVCEGWATSASVKEAMGDMPVVFAINVGNLTPVGLALRAAYPELEIIFAADHDKSGAGVKGAHKAAQACGGRTGVRVPVTEGRDFNDVHVNEGLDAVKQQLENAPVVVEAQEMVQTGSGINFNKIPPLPPVYSKTGIPQAPRQQLVVDRMLTHLGVTLVKQKRDLFYYTGTHWKILDVCDHDRLKVIAQGICGNLADVKHLDSISKLLSYHIASPAPGFSMFTNQRDRANFQNGTLHVSYTPKSPEEMAASPGSGTNNYRMDFKPHKKEDYCNSILPMEYRPIEELPVNVEFENMLRRAWPDSDPDADAKIWVYKELLGAALIPMFGKIFFFIGPPRCGKSTLIMIVRKLLGDANVSSVDPSIWGRRFGTEGMIGKLANIHTDVNTKAKISDSVMKLVIDQVCTNIERKNEKDAEDATLPALQVFGSQDTLASEEGGSGAYDRRAIIIRTETPQSGQGGGGEYMNWVWNQGPEGVLRAALEGLKRLLSNGGHFTQPASSKRELTEWGLESDFVGQFLKGVEHGEVKSGSQTILVGKSMLIGKRALHESYVEFIKQSAPDSYTMSEMAFTKRLRQEKRFMETRVTSGRYWLGIGFGSPEEGSTY